MKKRAKPGTPHVGPKPTNSRIRPVRAIKAAIKKRELSLLPALKAIGVSGRHQSADRILGGLPRKTILHALAVVGVQP